MINSGERTAFHEGCHIVANAAVGLAPIIFANIVPNGKHTGHVRPEPDNYEHSKRLYEFSEFALHDIRRAPLPKVIDGKPVSSRTAVLLYARTIMLVAAGDAVRNVFGGPHDIGGDSSDIRKAEFYAGRVTSDLETFLNCARVDAARIIRENISKVEAIAAALLSHGQLDGAEIAAVLAGRSVHRARWSAMEASARRFTASFGGLEARIL